MTTNLSGDVIVVTGAGSGIGREYALLAARGGARIVVNDIGGARDDQPSSADRVVDEIQTAGGIAISDYTDVTMADAETSSSSVLSASGDASTASSTTPASHGAA
ncbi:SDR family NAD(P)-dependent oxidoreductase [Microbacterium sp. LMI12-1-1.1]|uniref:SDR family NAD(P)-dependent oxidoreductase n=1 Tax=Microbacterium sp. LMI12-1-1.1 TaxID=3135225 RepID=UPI003435A29C